MKYMYPFLIIIIISAATAYFAYKSFELKEQENNQSCLKYKNALDNVEEIKKLKKSLHRIVVKGEGRFLDSKNSTWTKIKSGGGTSFSIGDGFSIALTHATDLPKIHKEFTKKGFICRKREIRNPTYWIGEKQIKLIGKIGDISLFKKPWEDRYPFKLGEDPQVGTVLTVIGDSMLNGNNIKIGIVSMMNLGRITKDKEIIDAKHCFLHTTPVTPGDSGSPALTFNNKKNEYVVTGIINGGHFRTYVQLYNFALRVSHVKKVIKQITKNYNTTENQ